MRSECLLHQKLRPLRTAFAKPQLIETLAQKESVSRQTGIARLSQPERFFGLMWRHRCGSVLARPVPERH